MGAFSTFLLIITTWGTTVVLFISVGLLVVVLGLWTLSNEMRISKYGLLAPGTVIAIEGLRRRGRRKRTQHYQALIRFQPREGNPTTLTVPLTAIQHLHIDQSVSVIYLPDRPMVARIQDHARWTGPLLLTGFGLLFAMLPILFSVPLLRH